MIYHRSTPLQLSDRNVTTAGAVPRVVLKTQAAERACTCPHACEEIPFAIARFKA
jgi:hypothetical protein